jgi:hypothetical protein
MLQTLLVGNGESRLKIKKFPAHDQIIVCNAAYKHFKTDNVVAVDKRMINEALSNSSATVWSRPDCVREYFNNNRVKVLPTIPVPHDERMFNSYNWGGYLLWELPEYPVFIDGRTDLYDDELVEEWLRVVRAARLTLTAPPE